MARPVKKRRICYKPNAYYFKPRGIPVKDLGEVVLTIDELEAIRLADLEDCYQESAAEQMAVSRQTFGNIIKSAHKKIATALVQGCALRIEGGEFTMIERKFKCDDCQHEWTVPFGTGRPNVCPQCGSKRLHHSQRDGDPAGYGKNGRGRNRNRGHNRRQTM
ncbi:MAG: DUF134 domain-containing protein [Xanthomonadales bacterium]|nr:DUF134 domain-containing protein [Xanthomonadales bacterium]